MSYSAIVAAVKTQLEAVSGIEYVLDYEPSAIHETPMIYLLLDGLDRVDGGDAGITTTYRIMATLVIRWQHNEQAEQDVLDLVDNVSSALDSDITLGGMNGYALIVGAEAGYLDVSGTKYRIVEFSIEAVETAC